MEETEEDSEEIEEVHVEWAVVVVAHHQTVQTCNKELATGSARTRVVVTRTLPGGRNATSASLPNPKVSMEELHSPLQEVTVACVEAEAWIVVGQVDLEVSVGDGVVTAAGTVAASEVVEEWTEVAEEWTEADSAAEEDHPWTVLGAGAEEWDPQERT